MLSVHLYDVAFHAFHGIYEEETKVGNTFQVSLTVTYDESNVVLNSISNIINYETLYEIVRKRMAIPSPLLEEVADTIISKIRHEYPVVREITLSIFKMQPPIEGFQGKAGITLLKKFV